MLFARLVCVSLGIALILGAPAAATTSFTYQGTVPSTFVNVRFRADLTIVGDTLTVVLTNDSLNHPNGPAPSRNPNDLISSFYFDIASGVNRPTLTYTGATGDVCRNAAADNCGVTQQPGDGSDELDLRAVSPNDDGWQFRSGLSLVFASTPLAFGIGTAGNNLLSPNNFSGNVVDGIDYSIYAGTPGTSAEGGAPSLNGSYLVHNSATFTFTGVSGYTEANIGPAVLFGLGTAPDSTAFVVLAPEPSPGLLLMLGLAGFAYRRRRC